MQVRFGMSMALLSGMDNDVLSSEMLQECLSGPDWRIVEGGRG